MPLDWKVRLQVADSIMRTIYAKASQKPSPMDECLAKSLEVWRAQSRYRADTDWVFASVKSGGRLPYWGGRSCARSSTPLRSTLASVAD
jgi:hypothetical protein